MRGRKLLTHPILKSMRDAATSPLMSRKPLALARALKILARYKLTGRIPFWFVNMALTNDCNMRCQHCYTTQMERTARHQGKRELSTDEFAAVVDEVYRLGAVCFEFQGGEVFLHPGLERIIKACHPSRSLVSIITNNRSKSRQSVLGVSSRTIPPGPSSRRHLSRKATGSATCSMT